MARLALTVAGAAVGSFFGMPALGTLAGSVLGQVLFPASNNGKDSFSEGPRLSDMSVSASSYGVPITRGFGTFRIAGNLIWAPGLQEHKHVDETSSGGKGGGGSKSTQTAVSYTYSASFAVAFGEGEIEDVLTIWADTKIIYDKTASLDAQVSNTGVVDGTTVSIVTQLSSNEGGATKKLGLTFRKYSGTMSQRADPLIAADPRIAEGHVPGFRGLFYIVFENLDLTDFGNRIPQISVLVTYKQSNVSPYGTMRLTGDLGVASLLALDPYRHRFYGWSTNSAGRQLLVSYDASTFSQIRGADYTDNGIFTTAFNATQGRGIAVGPNGYLYSVGEVSGTTCNLWKIDPFSLSPVVKSYYPLPTILDGPAMWELGFNVSTNKSTVMRELGFAACYGMNGLTGVVLATAFVSGVLAAFTLDELSLIWYDGYGVARQITDPILPGMHMRSIQQMHGVTYLASMGTYLKIWALNVGASVDIDLLGGTTQTVGIWLDLLEEITAADIADAAGLVGVYTFTGYGYCSSSQLDQNDKSLLLQIALTGSPSVKVIVKWREGAGIIWATVVPAFWPKFSEGTLTAGSVVWMNGATIYSLELSTGQLASSIFGHSIGSVGNPQYYLQQAGVIITRPGSSLSAPSGYSSLLVAAMIEVGGGGATNVSSIILSLAEESGLQSTDLDVTQISGLTIPGYFIARMTTARDALQPLLDAFALDTMESDGKLRFVPRGQASVRTIPQSELAASTSGNSNNEWFKTEIKAQWDLPASVTVSFIDPALAFQANTAIARRPRSPIATMQSSNDVTVEIPVAWSASEARSRAETLLYSSWLETAAQTWATSWKHIDLDPTDVVTLALDDGSNIQSRLTHLSLGADWTLEAQSITQDAYTYIPSSTPAAGSIVPISQRLVSAMPSQLFVMQTPLLRDGDNPGALNTCFYFAAVGLSDLWRGAEIHVSVDNVIYEPTGQIINQTCWGVTTNALPDNVDPFSWDTTTELNVWFTISAGLESVTDTEVLTHFKNAFAVKNTDGNWEIIQAATIEEQSDGSFTLSRLLRGRRGTDVFCENHGSSDTIVALYNDGSIGRVFKSIELITSALYMKAVTFGQTLEETVSTAFILAGQDLKPYMPRNAAAVLTTGPSVVTLSWLRRTRFQGNLVPGTGDVPLNETVEAYEVDVLDGSGGAVLRTLTSSTESVVYGTSALIADWGGSGIPPAYLHLKIYEMSSVVGRGLSREIAVEVTS